VITESFEYHAPESLSEASRLLAQFGSEGKILAGGHSLVPLMRLRLAAPKHVIDIGRVGELKYIREEGGKILIGALTTHYQIESSELLKQTCPLLPETARQIGDVQVRNKGTLGGSLAHADPAADWPAAMVALEAEFKAVSQRGERWIGVNEFFLDMLTTALEPDEILAAIRVPSLPEGGGDAYVKMPQPASGFAIVGVAARVVLDTSATLAVVQVGITGVGPKAYRASEVENRLRGHTLTEKRLAEAVSHAAEGVDPNSDLYASAEYRAHLAGIYTKRAIVEAFGRVVRHSTGQ
jgi:carbon-monoxide dehydrogenase medium subunit